MSWLSSIADTLSLNDDVDPTIPNNHPPNSDSSSPSSPRGVKEDLSEITKTLSRQFWGVASFLAPPPHSEPYKPLIQSSEPKGSDQDSDEGISGIRSDLSEIGGRFKSGFSKLSENINVSEITKMAAEFLNKAVEEMNEEAAKSVVGISVEVVAFANDLGLHPETWLDFPFNEDHLEEGFDMSDAQQEHALAVERLVPSLAALRIELCPEYISESFFWMIYFVLLHSKLDKEVAVILSTPQVMEVRALLTAEHQKHSKEKQDNVLGTTSVDQKDSSSLQHEVSLSVPSGAPENTTQNVVVPISVSSSESPDNDMEKHTTNIDIQVVEKPAISSAAPDSQTDKHPIGPSEIQIVDKSVIELEHNDQNKDQIVQSGPSNASESIEDEEEDDDGDDWLKEETSELVGGATETTIPIENDEDVSFSDLEDDDEDTSTLKKANYTSDKDSREWVQL